MSRVLSLAGLAVLSFVFLGNALKSVITSTVFLSQGEFASFLNISVDKTQILIELLIGGSIMALALAPFILNGYRARKIATISALGSTLCFALLGWMIFSAPGLWVREILVITTFALGGFFISFFAPIAQMAINAARNEHERTLLATVWTSAQTVAALITPQLVKHVAPIIGLDIYFLLFSLLPILYLLLTFRVLKLLPTSAGNEPDSIKPDGKLLGWMIVSILAFEAWTGSNSLAGVTAGVSLTLMLLFFVAALLFYTYLRKVNWASSDSAKSIPKTAVLLLITLFFFQIPSTGFFENAYLVRHHHAPALIDNRASLGAALQITSVLVTGALYMRWPHYIALYLMIGILLLFAGTYSYTDYPSLPAHATLFYTSKMLTSAGMGAITTACIAVTISLSRDNPVIALLPALMIMFGTECGLEILEIIFQVSILAGHSETTAYEIILFTQVGAVVLATIPCLRAYQSGLH
ncbi:MAG: hypothetical protein GY779_16340 [Gammaproteobacteria bacterium]|nr:hypothetical protein [Gammaproteobacteria bacterium]